VGVIIKQLPLCRFRLKRQPTQNNSRPRGALDTRTTLENLWFSKGL
jgi:hypothetical protein